MRVIERSRPLGVPSSAITLMSKVYKHILPKVHEQLRMWRTKAEAIPDDELRTQALASIDTKTFHCEGGAILALLALDKKDDAIRFIVAYQTISDYLDNLCDRSTSLDPDDFRSLHEAIMHALTPGQAPINYYQYRKEQEDGGYLQQLVLTCQSVIERLPQRNEIERYTHELASYYCDLQVHKHVREEERVPRLERWFEQHKARLPEMSWYEFSACAGSTLGIFCLVSYAFRNDCSTELFAQVTKSYFPWVQGLHILLDYFIDQQEDREGGDLNFCFYYEDEEQLKERFIYFIEQADKSVQGLSDVKFHQMINDGMLAIYLADKKVNEQKKVAKVAKDIRRKGGRWTKFFYVNGLIYRRLKGR